MFQTGTGDGVGFDDVAVVGFQSGEGDGVVTVSNLCIFIIETGRQD